MGLHLQGSEAAVGVVSRRPRAAANCAAEVLEPRRLLSGATLLADIYPGATGSSPFGYLSANGQAFFAADDGVNGRGLWKSNGTPSGTSRITALENGVVTQLKLDYAMASGNWIYFGADDGKSGEQLWRTDGTQSNTTMVKNLGSGPWTTFINLIGTLGNEFYFTAANGVDGARELYRTDGTAAGTVAMAVQTRSSDIWYPHASLAIGNTLYFTGQTVNPFGQASLGLWKVQNTSTNMPIVAYAGFNLFNIGSKLFYTNGDGGQLWVIDGNNPPTSQVDNANEDAMAVFGNELYYGDLNQLWKTDGTASGTSMVTSLPNFTILQLQNAGNTLFIAGSGPSELWKSDGTAAGTISLSVFSTIPASIPIRATFGNSIYFSAGDSSSTDRLWVSDGTVAGTQEVAGATMAAFDPSFPGIAGYDAAVIGGDLYFSPTDSQHGMETWVLPLQIAPKLAISGSVFNDSNANGSLNTGEAKLKGWRVYLDSNNNGKLDGGELSTLTDSSGNYSFSGLAAGTYHVRDVMQSGWRATTASSYSVTLATSSVSGKNFGVTQKAAVSGVVFLDSNKNGKQDSGEKGLSGFRVYVDANHNGKFDTGELSITTDANGKWNLGPLAAGTYVIRVAAKSGYSPTLPAGGKFTITLAAGTVSTGHLFGEKPIA